MPSFRVGGIWVLKIENFLSYALIFYKIKLLLLKPGLKDIFSNLISYKNVLNQK